MPRRHAGPLVIIIAVGIAAVAWAFLPLARLAPSIARQDQLLMSEEAPYGAQSLTLALSRQRAERILGAWQSDTDIPDLGDRPYHAAARQQLALDGVFVWPYTRFLLVLATSACGLAYLAVRRGTQRGRRPRWPAIQWAGLLAMIAALAGADLAENRCLAAMLTGSDTCVVGSLTADSLMATRLFAQVKFGALMVVSLGILLSLLIGVRGLVRRTNGERTTQAGGPPTFERLIAQERNGILGARGEMPGADVTIRPEAAGEPWVAQCREDFVGLALSGGGIRSATFNLGLLQGLHRLGLLGHVDYVATVSGGGYVGGFWSRWLQLHHRDGKAPAEPFPDALKEEAKKFSGDSRVFEAPEVRHLREFGNFLLPRVGLFDSETWGGVVALVASVLPACLAALSVLGLSLIGWLGLTFYLACPGPWARVLFLGGATIAVLVAMERWWRSAPTGDVDETSSRRVMVTSVVAVLLVGYLAWLGLDRIVPRSAAPASYAHWWAVVGIAPGDHHAKLVFSPRLYEPALVWAVAALAFIAYRFRGAFVRTSMKRRVMLPSADRTTMRLLGMATCWMVLATVWHVGLNLRNVGLLVASVSAGGSATLFVLLRNWMGTALARSSTDKIVDRIKPYVPLVLAYATVALAWAVLAGVLVMWGQQDWFRWYLAAFAMGALATSILLVDPQEFGLHAYYRDRICRAYLGAALPGTADQSPASIVAGNRQTDLREGDDVALTKLLERPLHLVCCAANELSGDHLASLSRGARSAVLSRYGVAMGSHWTEHPGGQLGAALTASAAAFNSNMGSVSMRVGPAVSFLMSALNLRLGLWVPNPSASPGASASREPGGRRKRGGPGSAQPAAWPVDRLLPGWLFYREMFAGTDTVGRDLHLSDGAHFDNLGLYELVRRHCRYIIVSDCTADPEVSFDDFGSTARRIREDFGVEIDIDLDPLKPRADGRARQSAVVGTVDYGWFDKGVLVYVKPTLTGTEPLDIRQYKTRNHAFPHESTGDQFYDEAQWESYRRLGVHVVRAVFGFSERMSDAPPAGSAHALFASAKQEWYPAPDGLVERTLGMSTRFAQLEEELKQGGSVPMLIEVFPELERLDLPTQRGPLTQDAELANLGCLLRVLQLMEDAVLAYDLQLHWNHPLNLGWVNAFARWATAPTFQMWWPLLKPMYGPNIRKFLEDRFVVLRDSEAPKGTLRRHSAAPVLSGLALQWWQQRDRAPSFRGQDVFEYCLPLKHRGSRPLEIQVGLVAVKKSGNGVVTWSSNDFFVPPSLWGGGLGHRFLRALLDQFAEDGAKECRVTVTGPEGAMGDRTAWDERRGFVDFYRQEGFQLETGPPRNGSNGGPRQHLAATLSLMLRQPRANAITPPGQELTVGARPGTTAR